MSSTPGNVTNLGPCTVTFNNVDLGCVSNVQVSKAEKVHEAKTESFGDAPVAAWKGGVAVEVKMMLDETVLSTILTSASAHEALITGTTSTGTKLAAGAVVGGQITGQLLKCAPVGQTNKDFAIYKAFVATHTKKVEMTAEKAAGYEVVFHGLIDATRPTGDQLYSFGNTTAAV